MISGTIKVFALILIALCSILEAFNNDMDKILQGSNLNELKRSDNEGFRFAGYYQDHMVLQRSPESAIIWGYGSRNATVTMHLESEVYTSLVKPGPNGVGVWTIALKPHKAGGPFTISAVQTLPSGISGEEIALKDVLFGEVWVCSGQSNMQMSIQVIFNSTYELKQTVRYPRVRVFYVARVTYDELQYDLQGVILPWSIPTPGNIKGFSAVCWLYGKYLYDQLKIPVGLVHSSWGGTPVEAWSSPRALKACGLDNSTDPLPITPGPPQNNSVLWNGMIHPLVNMTIKGVIWYQGEQNTAYHRNIYNCSFPAMIDDWRKSWYSGTEAHTDPQFPFGFVQLSVLNEPDWYDRGFYSAIRWHQTADYGYAPNPRMPKTFMAVTIDLLDTGIPFASPHNRDKQDVAKRLALGAMARVYGSDVLSDGPFPDAVYQSSIYELTVTYPPKQRLVLHYTESFQVCCDLTTCSLSEPFSGSSWTNSTVKSWDEHSVKLDITACIRGVSAVRYAWSVTPCAFKQCQVYNKAGLPAAPFYVRLF